jgi:hypothetical protein
LGVVQYNPYGSLETVTAAQDRRANDSNGSLIAVSYEARASGVKRVMRYVFEVGLHVNPVTYHEICLRFSCIIDHES